jgi:succinate dehydrogenase/fumarate reductase flavoprotein subunit
MAQALGRLEEIWNEQVPLLSAYDPHYLRMALEARNMVLVAMFRLKSALARKESRQVLSEDYPDLDNKDWVRWVTLRREGEAIKVDTEEVPLERYRLKPKPERFLHPLWQAARDEGQIRIEKGQVIWV